jgi:hypothetical protein
VHVGADVPVPVHGLGRPLHAYEYGVAPPVGAEEKVTEAPVSTSDLLGDGVPTVGSELTTKWSVPLVLEVLSESVTVTLTE